MADASISQLIVLVVSLSIAVTVGGMVMQSAGMISGSIEKQGSAVSRQIETDIEIINDPEYMTENIDSDNVLVLYVKNIGSRSIPKDKSIIDIFVDGRYLSGENIENLIVVNGDSWAPSRVLKIITNYPESYLENLHGTDHSVKVMVYNNEDTLKFRTS